MLVFCDAYNPAAIVNGPLGKGLPTGKFSQATRFAEGDLRQQQGRNVQEGPVAKGRQMVESCAIF